MALRQLKKEGTGRRWNHIVASESGWNTGAQSPTEAFHFRPARGQNAGNLEQQRGSFLLQERKQSSSKEL